MASIPSPPVQVTSTVSFNGNQLDFTEWSVNSASYTGCGSATIHMPLSTSKINTLSTVDLINAAQTSLVEVKITFTYIYPPAPYPLVSTPVNQSNVLIFGGYLDTLEYDLRENSLVAECRDYSSVMMENTIKPFTYRNKTIQDTVTTIAKTYGFDTSLIATDGASANIGLTSQKVSKNQPKNQRPIGFYMHGDYTKTNRKNTVWEFLVDLAESQGYVVYTTPDKKLYFNSRGNSTPIPLVWGGADKMGDLLDLKITHNGRRNANIFVNVSSYTPHNGQLTNGTAFILSPAQAEITDGTAGLQSNPALATAQSQASLLLTQYNFSLEAQTSDQIQAEALSRAKDINSKEFILDGTTLGYAALSAGASIQFVNTGFPEIDNELFYVSASTHRFVTPQSLESPGFTTRFTAWIAPDYENILYYGTDR